MDCFISKCMFVMTRPKTSSSVNHVLLLPVHIDRNKIMVVSVNIVNVMQQGGPGKGAQLHSKSVFKSSTLTLSTEPKKAEL